MNEDYQKSIRSLRTYEHVALPALIEDPTYLVKLFVGDHLARVYGFHLISEQELEAAVTFRLSIFQRCMFADAEELQICRAVVLGENTEFEMKYNEERMTFEAV